jgi:hypothetical protein
MALDRKKLEKFIKRQFMTTPEDNPVFRLTLRHAMGGNKAATVLDLEVNPNESSIDVASRFEEAANDDAEGLGGLQSYVLSSYFTAVPDKIRERLSFRLAKESDSDDEINNTEAPTERGITQQLMRHNEANARVMTMGMAEVVRQQNRMIERISQTNETLMDKHFNVLELYEKMLISDSARDIDKMKVTSEIHRTDQVVEKMMVLAPAVVNRFMGKNMLPEKATPAEMMVMTLMKSLKPDQMNTIMSAMEPEQQLMIVELMQSQQRRDEAERKGEKK